MDEAMEAVGRLVGWAREAYAGDLVSVIVHGSLAFGCWGPSSDIDVLIVVEDGTPWPVGLDERLVAEDRHTPGGGFEISVLSRTAALISPHPIAYEYHYSRRRVGAGPGRDPDLAGHFMVAWSVGRCVFGEQIKDVLRRVRDEEFRESILADFSGLAPGAPRIPVPVYAVLNLARTWAWLEDGLVLSKRDGGVWLRDREVGYAALLTVALEEYADPRGRLVDSVPVRNLGLEVGARLSR